MQSVQEFNNKPSLIEYFEVVHEESFIRFVNLIQELFMTDFNNENKKE